MCDNFRVWNDEWRGNIPPEFLLTHLGGRELTRTQMLDVLVNLVCSSWPTNIRHKELTRTRVHYGQPALGTPKRRDTDLYLQHRRGVNIMLHYLLHKLTRSKLVSVRPKTSDSEAVYCLPRLEDYLVRKATTRRRPAWGR